METFKTLCATVSTAAAETLQRLLLPAYACKTLTAGLLFVSDSFYVLLLLLLLLLSLLLLSSLSICFVFEGLLVVLQFRLI